MHTILEKLPLRVAICSTSNQLSQTTLKERDLQINRDRTEEFIINRQTHEWRKCRYLGSMLDTHEDIKRRKTLSINAAINLNATIFNNKKLSIQTKMSAFRTYIEPVFLYNCELWSITISQTENIINSFQRRLLRSFVLNVRWPEVATNAEVYHRTEAKRWSETIRLRRLRWLGKALRDDNDTPMKKALQYANGQYQRPRGKPATTWLSVVKNDLKLMNLTWDEAIEIAKDSKQWETIISH